MDYQRLVFEYQQSRCPDVFALLYENLIDKLRRTKEYYTKRYNLDEQDVAAIYDDAIWEVTKSYDPSKGDFVGILKLRIKSRIFDLVRKLYGRRINDSPGEESGRYKNVPYDAATVDAGAHFHCPLNLEEDVIKRRDQRHLISSLAADADDFTQKILLLLPGFESPNALATELGINPPKVYRALARLRRNFDATKFGDLSDYLSA